MSGTAAAILAATLVAQPTAAAEPAGPCRTIVRTGMTPALYAEAIAANEASGYRLVREAVGGGAGTPQFAAVWTNDSGPPRKTYGAHGHEAFYRASLRMTGQDYRMVDLAVGVVAGAAYYSALWEKGRDLQQSTAYWASEAEVRKSLELQGRRAVAIVPFRAGGAQFFATLIDIAPSLQNTAAVGLSAAALAKTNARMSADGFILDRATPYGQGKATRYAAVWRARSTGACEKDPPRYDLFSSPLAAPRSNE